MAGVGIFPIISAVGSVFQGFMGAFSSSGSGDAQAAAYNYNAAVARNNAMAAQQAAYANATQQERINKQRLANMEAKILHNGVLMEGTPLLLIQDEAAQGELEKQKIIHQGQVQAANYQNQATLDTYQGQAAQAAGSTKALSSIGSGIFSAGSALFRN